MTDWHQSAWEFFKDVSEHRPLRVFMSTYGLDADFLATELLPLLLDIGEKRETSDWYFEIERLLNDCLVDVAVDARAWGKSTRSITFQALGGCVHPVLVARGNQHAKLWLAEYKEFVRIAIGSANLTRGAFCNQIQYLWMADLEKKPQGATSSAGKESISRLQKFLILLGQASSHHQSSDGENEAILENEVETRRKPRKLSDVLESWCKLLGTVNWPGEVTLIPGVPSENQEGSTALKYIQQILPQERTYHLDIQVFSVGQIQQTFIDEIRVAFRAQKSINLFWPEESTLPPPWKSMELSNDACVAWTSFGGNFFALDFDSDLVDKAQDRLPHGKIYAWYTRKDQKYYDWLLLGSSNLSETAWKYSFELNVLIKGNLSLPLDYGRYGTRITPYCKPSLTTSFSAIPWLEAWETRQGVEVTLYGKNLDTCTIEVLDVSGQTMVPTALLPGWGANISQSLSCTGQHARRILVRIPSSNQILLECQVVPLPDSLLEKIDGTGKTALQLRHEWILKRYGWDPNHCRPGGYRVDWLEAGMNLFQVIDRWLENGQDQRDADALRAAFGFFATRTPQTDEQMAFAMAAKEITIW